MEFIAPSLNYAQLAPILIVLGGALAGVLIEAFAPRASRYSSQLFVALFSLVASFAALVQVRTQSSVDAAMGSVAFDGVGVLLQGSILVIAVLSIFLIADQESFTALAASVPGSEEERDAVQSDLRVTEVFPLTLFAVAGMLLFPVATDLITLFVALEVLSLPLYLMAGLSRRRRLASQEAALKYFLLGAFPTAITGFMAAATKVAAFGAILRIFYVAIANAEWQWKPAMVVIAIITMVFGSVVAIAQRDVKRMLAYSSIAHAGFLLAGVIALSKTGLEASIFYLFAYGVATVGAFGVVTLVRDASGEVGDLNRWSGLGKRAPLLASAFAFFLLAFAGIPLTSGFIGKFSIFSAAYESGSTSILIAGVLSSAVAAFFYIRVIVLMFFKDPIEDGTSVVIPSALTTITITVSSVVTLILGIYPAPLIDFIATTATFIR